MPPYGSQVYAPYPGLPPLALWNAESPASGSKSAAAAIVPSQVMAGETISVEIIFSQAPGAFQIEIQTADTDADANYQTVPTVGTITTVGASSPTTVRAEIAIKARFLRLLMTTAPANSGTKTTANLSR